MAHDPPPSRIQGSWLSRLRRPMDRPRNGRKITMLRCLHCWPNAAFNACWWAEASEIERCESIAAAGGTDTIIAAGRTDVGELMALLSLCDGFVGNDSGAAHLASALGVANSCDLRLDLAGADRTARTTDPNPLSRTRLQSLPGANLPLRPLQLPARNRSASGNCSPRKAWRTGLNCGSCFLSPLRNQGRSKNCFQVESPIIGLH